MKKFHLPDTDLANFCDLPENQKIKRMEAKRAFVPPHSLEPVRRNIAVLLGARTPMFPVGGEDIRAALNALSKSCRKPADVLPNRRRAIALIRYRRDRVTRAVGESYRAHSISVDRKVSFTSPLILEIGGRPTIPFFDHRKSGELSAIGRDFVFAMNYHLLVDAFEQYSDYQLVILKYAERADGRPFYKEHLFDGIPRYSFSELSRMIIDTYALWDRVWEGKARSAVRMDPGPLFEVALG